MSQLIPAEIWTVAKTDQGNAVLVKPVGGDRAVPIFIGPLEAQNILLGLGEVEIPRPLTHDLLLHLLNSLEAQLVRVDIHTLSEGTFYSNLVLEHLGRRMEIDARPSDSLALAVRAGCPIFIDEDLVEEAGVGLEQLKQASTDLEADEGDDEPEPEASAVELQLADLRTRLEKAVAEENYELAASLRDEIGKLEKP
jgi:bifunctional DNase/RNase